MSTLDVYELESLHEMVLDQLKDKLLPALTRANRTGELRALLQMLLMDNLLSDGSDQVITASRVLVVGDGSNTSVGKLKAVIRKQGYDPDLFDFEMGYEELKHFNFERLRNTYTYKAVMAGAMPHSVPGKRDASSVITKMESQPENYPLVIRLKDSNGLKITRNSFLKGLEELSVLT